MGLFWKKDVEKPAVYSEFTGGLGDIINYMYTSDRYAILDRLAPHETATVAIMCHNPFAKELFLWHPKKAQITLRDLGFWWPNEDHIYRPKYGLPPAQPYVAKLQEKLEFYPSPADRVILERLKREEPYLVLSAAAGGVDRNIPTPICDQLVDLAILRGFKVVVLGRSYGNHRSEIRLKIRNGMISLVDEISVPGSAKAVEGAAGVLCCHSAICLLSWYMKRPTFVLYPEHVRTREFEVINHYSFGKDYPTTRHMGFSEYTPARLEEFLGILR